MKTVKLYEIAAVQMGYSFRTRFDIEKTGNVSVIQLKDLPENENGNINTTSLERTILVDYNEAHLIKPSDVVFRSRGLNTKSFVIGECAGLIVLAAPLFRLRIDCSKICPAYLSWYINQPTGQSYLECVAEGTGQKMINKKALAEMAIELPSMKKQLCFVEIANLFAKEILLRKEILQKSEKLFSAQLLNVLKGGVNGN